ncbi:hypothetical protein C8J35_10129 [Rhizobium sp. PP-F2F-G38]|nr:hypothetical protein C8J37_10129 [Rhizobium sp. PP-WC-1G-195]PYF00225.1 hypothetical protein C8J35_10129 [Rhizobium sp. PP-F2F-G38]
MKRPESKDIVRSKNMTRFVLPAITRKQVPKRKQPDFRPAVFKRKDLK